MTMSGTDYTQTPNHALFKPIYDQDVDAWGGHLNENADTLDTLLAVSGTLTFVPVAGGAMQGALTLYTSTPSAALEAASKGYVDANTLPLAPQDANTYGRHMGAWSPVVPIAGGSMTGPLVLSGDPTAAQQAATKNYVDGKTVAPIVSDTAPPTPVPGQLWWDSVHGELCLWFVDPNSSQWVVTSPHAAGPAGVPGAAGAQGPQGPSGPQIIPAAWLAGSTPNGITLFIASRALTITALVGVAEVLNGAAATVSVVKATNGQALSAGAAIHSGSFNANATAGTNQTLTLTTTTMNAGDRLGLVSTGTFTASVGSLSVTVQ
jgi:hypothetical protein